MLTLTGWLLHKSESVGGARLADEMVGVCGLWADDADDW